MYQSYATSDVREEREKHDQSDHARRNQIFALATRKSKRSAIEEEIHRDIFWGSQSAGEYAQKCKRMRIEPDMGLWYEVNP